MKAVFYGAIAVAAAATGFALYRFGIEPKITAGIDPSAPVATSASEAETSPGGVPTVLPDFSLADREGNQTSIRSWTGKSMIVNFWATWCGPCRREIPLLKELQDKQGDAGFQVVGVAVDVRDAVLKYADEMKIDYPILIGEQDALDAVNLFGLASIGFPFTVFTDNQGRIVLTHLGDLSEAQSDLILEAVTRVNAGEFTPAHARTVVAGQLAKLTAS